MEPRTKKKLNGHVVSKRAQFDHVEGRDSIHNIQRKAAAMGKYTRVEGKHENPVFNIVLKDIKHIRTHLECEKMRVYAPVTEMSLILKCTTDNNYGVTVRYGTLNTGIQPRRALQNKPPALTKEKTPGQVGILAWDHRFGNIPLCNHKMRL